MPVDRNPLDKGATSFAPVGMVARMLLIAVLACVIGTSEATSATSLDLPYSGRLTKATGQPFAGPVDLEINFYAAATGGSALGGSPFSFPNTSLVTGVFTITIPLSATALAAIFPEPSSSTWIEVTDKTNNHVYPRQRFGAVPYAFKVPVDQGTIAFDSNGALGLAITSQPGANQFLTKDSNGNLTWGTPSTAASTIDGAAISTAVPQAGQVLSFVNGEWTATSMPASITATPPLSVTNPTTAPQLSLAQANSVASGYLASSDWLTFNNMLSQSGGTMVGTLNMGGQSLTNLAAPVNPSDAVTKTYGDTSYLSVAGGTLSGSLSMSGQDMNSTGNLFMSSGKVLALSGNSTDPSGLASADKGKLWFNTSTNQVRYYDGNTVQTVGASGAGITSLNGLTLSAQSFNNGTSGTSPNFSSTGSTHTLNIPMAAGTSVSAGLLSNSDYNSFAAKVSSISAGAGLSGGPITTTGTLSLANVGVAGTYSKVVTDAYGRVIGSSSLLASDLPALSASSITSGTFNVAQIPALSASSITSGTLSLALLPNLPPVS